MSLCTLQVLDDIVIAGSDNDRAVRALQRIVQCTNAIAFITKCVMTRTPNTATMEFSVCLQRDGQSLLGGLVQDKRFRKCTNIAQYYHDPKLKCTAFESTTLGHSQTCLVSNTHVHVVPSATWGIWSKTALKYVRGRICLDAFARPQKGCSTIIMCHPINARAWGTISTNNINSPTTVVALAPGLSEILPDCVHTDAYDSFRVVIEDCENIEPGIADVLRKELHKMSGQCAHLEVIGLSDLCHPSPPDQSIPSEPAVPDSTTYATARLIQTLLPSPIGECFELRATKDISFVSPVQIQTYPPSPITRYAHMSVTNISNAPPCCRSGQIKSGMGSLG